MTVNSSQFDLGVVGGCSGVLRTDPRAVGAPAEPAAGDSLADAPPPPVVHRRLGHPSFRPHLPRGGPGGDVSGSAARVHHDGWVESTDRLVPLEGAFNFRDLGGYAGAGGRATRWGRLFRSDTLHELDRKSTRLNSSHL